MSKRSQSQSLRRRGVFVALTDAEFKFVDAAAESDLRSRASVVRRLVMQAMSSKTDPVHGLESSAAAAE